MRAISNLNVCLFPMSLAWGDKRLNLQTLETAVEKIPAGTDLLILPEMFSTGFLTSDKEEICALAETNSGPTLQFLRDLAASRLMAIAGSFIACEEDKVYNRAFLVEPSGEVELADKRHLFSMGGEDRIFEAGDTRLKVRYRGWNIAMVVCYDVRFPVWCRNVGNEYDLLIAVANWPKARVEAWDHLLKARAIENLSYVCGVNCTGTDNNGCEYNGISPVYDFKGKEIGIDSDGSPFRFASLSYEKLESFRKKFPAWNDADSFKITSPDSII